MVHSDVAEALDNGHAAVLLMLHLAVAFNTLDHQIVIEWLRRMYGFPGDVLAWTRSYLNDRRQVASIDVVEAAEKSLLFAMPQGSVLGPKVYCLYSKPVSLIVQLHGVTYHIYADDSQLYLFIKQFDDLGAVTTRIENCVSDVLRWMITNMLKLNESKTEIIFFTSRRKQDIANNSSFKFGDSVICPVTKNLGVFFNSHLSMASQVLSVAVFSKSGTSIGSEGI